MSRWMPGRDTGTEEVEEPGPTYSVPLARLVSAVLLIEALVALAYAGIAMIDRRSIFLSLAVNPAGVTSDEASSSDLLNRIAFITVGVVTAVALVLVVIWLRHVRKVGARVPLRWSWLAAAIVSFGGIAAALVMHTSDEVRQIANGYAVFSFAAMALTATAVQGLPIIKRVGAQVASTPDDAEPDPVPSWPLPRS